jgi:CBS domain-containing protein
MIGEICNRDVVIASRNTTVVAGAKLMRQHHVGNVVITDQSNGRRMPVGIVTDRDIVLEVLAQGLDPEKFSLGELMASELFTIPESEGIFQAIQSMRSHGVRRAPVVDRQGCLVGIVAVDDLLGLLAEELGELAKLVKVEQAHEAHLRP